MDFNINKTLCFTGHRPNKLYGYDKNDENNKKIISFLNSAIRYSINYLGIENFITGMALGVDQWAALEVIKLREETYPNIQLITAIPCIDHPSRWPTEAQDTWRYIFHFADINNYTYEGKYNAYCMQRRNRWMVDRSNGQIVVWDGTPGGTHNCIHYANTKNKKRRIVLNPKTFRVEESLCD